MSELLRIAGWRVERCARRQALPAELVRRYPWMPADYRDFVEETKLASSADEKAWFLTARDFAGEPGPPFAWNEWERQSIEAAEGDEELERRVVAFWDSHLPILLSVKSGYAYFAMEQSSLSIVRGEEPEYEETTPLAPSFAALLQLIKGRDRRLSRFI